MSTSTLPDPSIYQSMRDSVLFSQPEGIGATEVYAVLMDWHIGSGTASVLAAADGTASIYLSNGGGCIGGGDRLEEIREAAVNAVNLAAMLFSRFERTESAGLPESDEVGFFAMTGNGRYLATAREDSLAAGTDPLCALGDAMQTIIAGYQLISEDPPPSA